MRKSIKTLETFFSALLYTFPKTFRKEYGFEAQGVFRQILDDAANRGVFMLAAVALRELRDYPITLIREHWQNYQQKEYAMITNTPAITVTGCPRCGSIKEPDARFCSNCGLAFIPLKEYIPERVKNFFNSKLYLRIISIVIFIIVSLLAKDRVLFHGFHPATNIIVLSGTALLSFLTGWRLFSNIPNSKKIRFLFVIAVITLAFFKLSSELDELYLQNTMTANNPISYQFLDSNTYVDYVEEDRQTFFIDTYLPPYSNMMKIYIYFPPFDKLYTDGLTIWPAQPYPITKTRPALIIERSWVYKDYYGLFFKLIITSFAYAGFFGAKKIVKRSLVYIS